MRAKTLNFLVYNKRESLCVLESFQRGENVL